jgi:hypothetical protein
MRCSEPGHCGACGRLPVAIGLSRGCRRCAWVTRSLRTAMKTIALIFLAGVLLSSSGCMTSSVLYDARHPNPNDNAPWANYLLLPIIVPADIATSPIQIPAFIAYVRNERPSRQVVPMEESSK